MIKRFIAVGSVALLWVLTLLQVYATLTNPALTGEWQFAHIVPLVLISIYSGGLVWAWLKRGQSDPG